MDRKKLIKHIIGELTAIHQTAIAAAKRAHKTATDKANIAENKYDTFGLEASYLAQGQARRVSQCEANIKAFHELLSNNNSNCSVIKMGSLVTLEDESAAKQTLFLGPAAGGLKINYCDKEVLLITSTSPLGHALMGLKKDDEFELVVGDRLMQYLIINVH